MKLDRSHWMSPVVRTRQGQLGLLAISFFWGISYLIPSDKRVKFSEVFPPSLDSTFPIQTFGWLLLISAGVAMVAEQVLVRSKAPEQSRVGWWMTWLGHTVLASVYATLVVGAMITVAHQSNGEFYGVVSGVSRWVLWSVVAFWHFRYATLPRRRLTPK